MCWERKTRTGFFLYFLSGGYKGYGLAMMVDVFCGVLSGSAFGTIIKQWQAREDDTRIADLVMICLSFLVPGFQRGLGPRALGL